MKFCKTLLFVIVLMSIAALGAYAQGGHTACKGWIQLDDLHITPEYVQWGEDSSATFQEDSALNEQDIPPPPSGHWYRWLRLPTRSTSTLYTYLDYNDMHPFPSTPTKRDSFILAFQMEDPTYDLILRWDHARLAARWTRIVMWFKNTAGLVVPGDSLDMTTVDTVFIPQPDPLGNNIPQAYIFAYGPTAIDGAVKPVGPPIVPTAFKLQQNYPNPFNPTTTIQFDIASRVMADVAVYNLLGQRIKTLHSGELNVGTYTAEWNGTSDNGASVASGVYFVRMKAEGIGNREQFTAVRKLLLMK